MEKNQKNSGFMVITSYIRERMETYRTGGDSDQPLSYMEVVKGLGISHQTWFRIETGKIVNCSWNTWTPIYKLLVENDLIDPNDISLMPPEILREKLMNAELNTQQVNNFYISTVFNDIKDAIMCSEMCDSCKIKAYKIIQKFQTKEKSWETPHGNNSDKDSNNNSDDIPWF